MLLTITVPHRERAKYATSVSKTQYINICVSRINTRIEVSATTESRQHMGTV